MICAISVLVNETIPDSLLGPTIPFSCLYYFRLSDLSKLLKNNLFTQPVIPGTLSPVRLITTDNPTAKKLKIFYYFCPMKQEIFQFALVVNDYDEAIQFYTEKLKFQLIEDTVMSESKRWVVVKPIGSSCGILLAKAANEAQLATVGNQTGGRVFLFMHTDDIERDYQNLLSNGIHIHRAMSEESFGKVLVFADLYGNLWDLIQPH